MDKKEEELMEELRRQLEGIYRPLGGRVEEEELLAVFREIEGYEASARRAGTRWPENLIASILGLEWAELKESVGGESVEEALSAMLETLTPRESKVIELFYKEEKGLIEIGQECNVSYATIRSILAKGVRKLRYPSRAGRLAAWIERVDDMKHVCYNRGEIRPDAK